MANNESNLQNTRNIVDFLQNESQRNPFLLELTEACKQRKNRPKRNKLSKEQQEKPTKKTMFFFWPGCKRCEEKVYAAEMIQSYGYYFHKLCFLCTLCIEDRFVCFYNKRTRQKPHLSILFFNTLLRIGIHHEMMTKS